MGSTCCGNQKDDDLESDIFIRCDPSSAWSTAIHKGDLYQIQRIYEENSTCLNSRVNNDGECALSVAVKRKDMQLIEFLLSKDINVNMKSIRTGNTPLHEAALKENVQILSMLLNKGADAKILNKNGRSAKSLTADREIKAILKPKNIERINTEESLRRSFAKVVSDDDDDDSGLLSRQYSDTFISETLSSDRNINESYIGKITEMESDREYQDEDDACSDDLNTFATRVGVEMHEIIYFFKHLPNKSLFWEKIIGENEDEIKRSKQLFKLTYSLVYATIKIKHNKKVKRGGEFRNEDGTIEEAKKPPSDIVKEFTRILKNKIKRGKDIFTLSKTEFIVGFSKHLHDAGQELLDYMALSEEDDTFNAN